MPLGTPTSLGEQFSDRDHRTVYHGCWLRQPAVEDVSPRVPQADGCLWLEPDAADLLSTFVWAGAIALFTVYVFFFIPETGGLSLVQVDEMYLT